MYVYVQSFVVASTHLETKQWVQRTSTSVQGRNLTITIPCSWHWRPANYSIAFMICNMIRVSASSWIQNRSEQSRTPYSKIDLQSEDHLKHSSESYPFFAFSNYTRISYVILWKEFSKGPKTFSSMECYGLQEPGKLPEKVGASVIDGWFNVIPIKNINISRNHKTI